MNFSLNFCYFICSLIIYICMVECHAQNYPRSDSQESMILNNMDPEHIAHDVKEQYLVDLDIAKATQKDLDYYNFQLHDYDQNYLLDGLEILVSINHDLKPDPSEYYKLNRMDSIERQQYWQKRFEEESEQIDLVLKTYDLDNDGYISFAEYVRSLNFD